MLCRNNVDPFDEPECEARDIFVNELLCIGTGTCCTCISSMVKGEGFRQGTSLFVNHSFVKNEVCCQTSIRY